MPKLPVSRTIIGLSCILCIFSLYCIFLFSHFNLTDLNEPKLLNYHSDELIYLKTFYLVKRGENYYHSLPKVFSGDTRNLTLGSDVFTWRMPTLYLLWKYSAGNGIDILRNFWVMAGVTLIAVFYLLKKISNVWIGLVGSILLLPYFADTFTYTTSFLFMEWWALCFFLIGFTFCMYKQKIPAWCFFLLAILIRELMIIPITAFLVISILKKTNRIFFGSMIVVFAVALFFHAINVQEQFTGSISSSTISAHLHFWDKNAFQHMIAFSMRQYPFISFKLNYLFLAISALGFITYVLKKKYTEGLTFLYIATYSLIILLPFISTSVDNDYWGILFMPLIIITAPLCLRGLFVHNSSNSKFFIAS